MKKAIGILLLLALCLSLCACGEKKKKTEPPQAPVSGVDPVTGAWQGQGGCYRTEPLELPKGAGVRFCHEGQIYAMGNPSMGETIVYRDGEELFRYEGMAYTVSQGEDGIWVQDEERSETGDTLVLSLYSFEGAYQETLRLELPAGCFSLGMAAAGDKLYLKCSDTLRVYDREGNLLCVIPHEEWQGNLLRGGDGKLYFLEERKSGRGGVLSAIDVEKSSFMELFSWDRGFVSGGDSESPFLQILPEGIFRMNGNGETRPLVLWDECLLSVSGVTETWALGDDRFLLGGMFAEPLLLLPAQPEDIKPRAMLTLAVLPTQDALDFEADPTTYYADVARSISAFNAQSRDCYVKLLDLSEGGSLTAEQALTKLNTKIISGQVPDMLVLNGSLSPFGFIRQGLLRDLKQDLESDPDLNEEDLILARAIENDCGGL